MLILSRFASILFLLSTYVKLKHKTHCCRVMSSSIPDLLCRLHSVSFYINFCITLNILCQLIPSRTKAQIKIKLGCCPRYLEGNKVSVAEKTEACICVYVCGIEALLWGLGHLCKVPIEWACTYIHTNAHFRLFLYRYGGLH